jgi:hypothetical protein
MRWLYAGGGLSSLNSIHQCAARTFIHSEHQPKCLSHSPVLALRPHLQVASCWRPAQNRDQRHHQIHITRCKPVPNFLRLRALALFGRRPVERAGLSLLPASKNQHITKGPPL